MARLFGFISKQIVDFHIQTDEHSRGLYRTHGCGLGWYDVQHVPHVKKQKLSAINPYENVPINETIQSHCVLLHMRQATSGLLSENNTHPFSFQHYLFAHTGTVRKEPLIEKLKPPFSNAYQSEPIDSELLFRYIIQSIEASNEHEGLVSGYRSVPLPNTTTSILATGTTLCAYRQGHPLYWLSWKPGKPFSVRSKETGLVMQSNNLSTCRAIIVASERLTDDNWMIFDDSEMLTVRDTLQYNTEKL